MTGPDVIGILLVGAVGIAAGLLLGRIYFELLWRSAEGLAVGGHPLGAGIALVLRVAAAAGVLWLLARWHPVAVLGGLAGFTLARLIFKLRAEGHTS
jgi:hypothetical protein